MSEIEVYEQEPFRRQLDTDVVAVGRDETGPWVVFGASILLGEDPNDRPFLADRLLYQPDRLLPSDVDRDDTAGKFTRR